jgi:hypothetical protein
VCVSVGRERGDTARTMGMASDCGCLLWDEIKIENLDRVGDVVCPDYSVHSDLMGSPVHMSTSDGFSLSRLSR